MPSCVIHGTEQASWMFGSAFSGLPFVLSVSGGMLESSYNVKSCVSITSSGHGRPCHHNRFLMLLSWLSPGDSAWGPRVSGNGWQAGVPAAPQVFCSSLYIPFTSNISFSFSFWAPLSSLSFSLNSLF